MDKVLKNARVGADQSIFDRRLVTYLYIRTTDFQSKQSTIGRMRKPSRENPSKTVNLHPITHELFLVVLRSWTVFYLNRKAEVETIKVDQSAKINLPLTPNFRV